MTASKSAIAAAKVAAALSDRWLHEDRLIAVAIGLPKHGASFLPHFPSRANLSFWGDFEPTESARGTIPLIPVHVAGNKTDRDYLDYCFFLGGNEKRKIWLGTLGEAKSKQIIRRSACTSRNSAPQSASSRLDWNETPDRIAVWGLTPCGRIEKHKKIDDGRTNVPLPGTVRF